MGFGILGHPNRKRGKTLMITRFVGVLALVLASLTGQAAFAGSVVYDEVLDVYIYVQEPTVDEDPIVLSQP
jgi:hypothetical protein